MTTLPPIQSSTTNTSSTTPLNLHPDTAKPSPDPSAPIPYADDHGDLQALAEHYAALLNDYERAGLEPTETGLWKIAKELSRGDWVLYHDPKDEWWKVMHADDAPKVIRYGRDTARMAVYHCPYCGGLAFEDADINRGGVLHQNANCTHCGRGFNVLGRTRMSMPMGRDGRPMYQYHREGLALHYEAKRVPKGYVVNKDGKTIRAGKWVSEEDLRLAVPVAQGSSKGKAVAGKQASGAAPATGTPKPTGTTKPMYPAPAQQKPNELVSNKSPELKANKAPSQPRTVNHEDVRSKLYPHTHRELSKDELTRTRRSFGALQRHHGELTPHRIEELVNGVHEALQHVHPEDKETAERLGKRLKGYEQMLGWHREGKAKGKPKTYAEQIKGKDSPGKPAKPEEALNTSPWLSPADQKIERETQERARTDYDGFKKRYLDKMGVRDANGKLKHVQFNTDEWRDLFPEYHGTNAAVVHEASSYLNKRLLAETMVEMKGVGNNTFAVLSGGGGSGKGTSTKQFYNLTDYPIVVDQVSDKTSKVNKMLDEAKAAGYDTHVAFIDRNPRDAWLNGVVKRAVSSRQKGQLARTVPLAIALEANIKAREAAIELIKEGKHSIAVVDGNHGVGEAVIIRDPKEQLAHLEKQKYNSEQLKKELEHDTRGLHERGEIPDDIAEGLVGPRPADDRLNQPGRPEGSRGGQGAAQPKPTGQATGVAGEGAAPAPVAPGSGESGGGGKEAKSAAPTAAKPTGGESYYATIKNKLKGMLGMGDKASGKATDKAIPTPAPTPTPDDAESRAATPKSVGSYYDQTAKRRGELQRTVNDWLGEPADIGGYKDKVQKGGRGVKVSEMPAAK